MRDGHAATGLRSAEPEYATLRGLLNALGYESAGDDEAEGLVEEYVDTYLDEDLGVNLFVNLSDGDDQWMSLSARMSFYAEEAVDMWVLDAPFTVSSLHGYLDELDRRVRRLRAIVELPASNGNRDEVSVTGVLARLFDCDEAKVVARTGDDWVPLASEAVGMFSVPTRYLLWNHQLVVGLDDEYVHLFTPCLGKKAPEVGDVLMGFSWGEEETIDLEQFARALENVPGSA